jgi:serine/threonine-protein kinase
VHLFDFGIADDGAFYYVMELLEGFDADRMVQKFGPLPAERVIHVVRQICHSLAEAEAAGLVHRDIKPGNVFLCRYGEDYDFVKVLDFGIVKGLREEGQALPVLAESTVDHVVQGTPAFIAPEQAMGATVDSRADIYAVGCVAYWLLTGQFVFTADTPMRLLVHHAHTPPEPPSTRTELPIPPALDALIMQCLAKDPNDRPQTARDLARRLAEIEGADRWTEEHAREWWTLHAAPESPVQA